MNKQTTLVTVALMILLAAAVRFHLLGAQSLWNDEGSAYVQATRTFNDIAINAASDIHPPGYYWMLALWRLLTGETEFALRSLSAFASILTVALAFATGKRLYGLIAGLAAAIFVTLNTFSIYYAQEARMYALLALWSAASMWAFAGFMRTKKRSWAVALALFNVAGLWTHYAFPAVMVAQGVLFVLALAADVMLILRRTPSLPSPVDRGGESIGVPLMDSFASTEVADDDSSRQPAYSPSLPSPADRGGESIGVPLTGSFASTEVVDDDSSRQPAYSPSLSTGRGEGGGVKLSLTFLALYILANLLTIVLYLPWLPTALRQVTAWPSTGTPIPLEEAIPIVIGWLTFGITYEMGGATIAVTFFLLFGLLSFPNQDGKRTWWRMLLPPVWVLVTLGGFLALELFREANLKFLLPAQIGYALWLGRGVWTVWTLKPRRTARLFTYAPKLAAAVGTVALVSGLWSGLDPLYTRFQRDNYRGIVEVMNSNPEAAVILNAPGQEEVFRYYAGERDGIYPLPRSINPDNEATQAEVRQIIENYPYIYAVLWGTDERDPQNIVENTLNQEAYQVDDVWYGDVRLVRYATPAEMGETIESGARFGEHIMLKSYALSAETIKPGETLQVRLDWETHAILNLHYKVFVQLLHPDGTLAAQRDGEPVSGLRPTTSWTPGEIIHDNHAVTINNNLASPHYTLIIGFYNPDNPLERLPVSGGDYLILGWIEGE